MSRLARALGVATAAYATATLVRPRILSRPTGLGQTEGTAVLVRAVGVRDVAIGGAVALAPTRAAMTAALAARIAADLGDAVVFGLSDLPVGGKRRALTVAIGWAALNAAVLAGVRRGR